MELFGSLDSIQGAITASAFSGSFTGDGSKLYNIQASGVTGLNLSQIATGSVTASVSPGGFNVNSDTSITGSLRVTGIITAEQLDITVVSSSVLFQSGSTKFGDSLDDNHNITGSVNISGSISLNGQAIGTGKLDETTFNSYTSSNNSTNTTQNNRLNSLESTTSSLNSFTNSINSTIKTKLNTEGVISGSIQVDITGTTNYSTFSSSIATVDSNQNSRLDSIEIMTNSLNNFSYSIDSTIKNKLNVENVVSTSAQIILTSVNGYSTFSSSIATTDSNQNSRLSSLETTSGSLNTFTASALTRVGAIETSTGALNTFTNSANSRLNSLETASGSIRSDFNTYTSSNDSTNTTQNSRLTSIESTTGSLNTFTSSALTRISAIETATSSLNNFTNSINTTIKNKLNSDNVVSGSVQIDITQTTGYSTFSSSISSSIGNISGSVATTTNTLSSSVASYNLGQDNRLNSLEGKTGSYATTGSNSFTGTQNITGSLFISDNLTVYGSSSLVYVTSSQLAVSSSFISVNVFEPAERFGGLKVYDSGSSNATASLAWDSLHNRWIYQNASGSNYNGAILIAGPRNTGSLGDESTLTSGKIPKSVGGDHIDNSIMNETNGVIYITGSLSATGTVYGTNITAIESTTSSLNSYTASNDSTNTTQNNRLTSIETSTGSLNSYTSSTNTRLTSIETSTGSLNSFTSSINTTIKNKLNSDGVISGSSQVDFNGISNKPTLVSGSSQITFSGISGLPTLVSGSSQITYGSISGIPSGIVSGSSQISFGSISGVPSGLVSGSSQISFGSISGVPSGLVSGSSQVAIASTTGFSTYLDQAVKSGSTVTFAGITNTSTYSGSNIIYSTYNTASGRANLGFSTAKTILGNIHVQNGSGAGNDNSNQAAITFQGGVSTEAQAGIYVLNNGSYGTSMGFATTESYSTGPQLFMTATNGGVVNFPRARPTYAGNTILDAANYTSYAMQGAGYSANQNLNTSNSVTFAGITSNGSISVNGVGTFTTSNDHQIALVSPDNWAGIQFDDSNSSPDYIWYHGSNQTFAIGGGGSNVSGKKLHVHGGMTIGTSLVSTASPSEGLTVAGVIKGASYFDAQASSGFRIRNSNDSANAGGWTRRGLWEGNANYDPALWAETGYGLYFYSNGSANIRAYFDTSGHFLPGTNNTYDLGSSSLGWRNVYTNDLHLSNMNKPEGNDIDGTKGNWTIQEGVENLYIINNNNGKKFKISLEEIK